MQSHPNLREVEDQTARELDALRSELAGVVAADQVDAVGRHHFQRLMEHATITEFVPLFVYRSTKEDVLRPRHGDGRARDATGLLATV